MFIGLFTRIPQLVVKMAPSIESLVFRVSKTAIEKVIQRTPLVKAANKFAVNVAHSVHNFTLRTATRLHLHESAIVKAFRLKLAEQEVVRRLDFAGRVARSMAAQAVSITKWVWSIVTATTICLVKTICYKYVERWSGDSKFQGYKRQLKSKAPKLYNFLMYIYDCIRKGISLLSPLTQILQAAWRGIIKLTNLNKREHA